VIREKEKEMKMIKFRTKEILKILKGDEECEVKTTMANSNIDRP